LYEENKNALDEIIDSKFKFIKKISIIIDTIESVFSNKINFDIEDRKIYKPKRNGKYYERWINKQGNKLKKRLYSLYELYRLKNHLKKLIYKEKFFLT
jgi:hypothetical protein